MAYLTGEVLTQADIAALFASGTYTPTLGNMAIGTGGTPTNTAKYTFVGFPAGGILTVEGSIKFGTTGVTLPSGPSETVSLPSGYALIDTNPSSELSSTVTFVDVSGGVAMKGMIRPNTTTTLRMVLINVSGANLVVNDVSATTPFTWAVSDEIYYKFVARCTGP